MSEAITITQLRLGDAPVLRHLFVEAVATDFSYFPGTYRRQVLRQNGLGRLAIATLRRSRLLLGATANGRLVGYAIGRTNRNATAKIYWLYVTPEWRSHGVGSKLLGDLMDEFRRRGSRQASLVTYKQAEYYRRKGFELLQSQPIYGVTMKVMVYRWPSR